jgi:hypothetical protein
MPPDISPSSPPDAGPMNHGGAPETPAQPDEARLALGQRVAELEAAEQRNAAIQAEMLRQAQAVDPIDGLAGASAAQKAWLKSHREILDDPEKFRMLHEAHLAAEAKYFAHLDHALGYRPAAHSHEAAHEPPPVMRTGPMVSAPVSRSGGASSGPAIPGRVVLSPAEREAARMSGVSETQYAANKMRLMREKAAGNYGPGPQR